MGLLTPNWKISIHAPHTGRDTKPTATALWRAYFNPRAPYGARLQFLRVAVPESGFQSTRPIRGATTPALAARGVVCYFNPRAPYGARLLLSPAYQPPFSFQSTRPIRGATHLKETDERAYQHISIHAPHTGRDRRIVLERQEYRISIHAPHTGRDQPFLRRTADCCKFQSTRPIRGATGCKYVVGRYTIRFQSTRPIRGATF